PVQLRRVGDRLPVECDDHVAGPNTSLVRFGRALHPNHESAIAVGGAELLGHARREVIQGDTIYRPAANSAVLHQVVDHVPREIARDGEPDALISAALAEDPGVDADELAPSVDERSAGVPWIDRGVGLYEVFVVGEANVGAAGRAHNACSDRLAQLKGAPDGEHPFTDLQFDRIAPG